MEWDCVITFLKKWIKISFLLLSFSLQTSAQIINETEHLIENDELIMESVEVDEDVNYKRRNKVSIYELINDIELCSIYFNENQRNDLKKHITLTGEIKDLLELQSISSFNYYDFKRLQNIINIDEENYKNKNSLKIQNRSVYQSKNLKNAIGSHWGNYQQVKLTLSNDIKLSYAREYDPGENIHQRIVYNKYDHHSFFMSKNWKKYEICLGSFQVFQGFGLLLGQGFSNSFGNGGINNLIQHRWNGNANQSEYNYFNGMYIRKQINDIKITLGISSQKIDIGNSFGFHRTTNEISKKNKNIEKVVLLGIEKNTRKFNTSIIFINDISHNKIGLSQSSQFYFRNIISFYEYSFSKNKSAYTFGMMLVLGKDIQISISQSHFDYTYSSNWSATRIQSFSINDDDGLILNILFPYKKKWVFNYSHKVNFKLNIEENKIEKSINNTDLLRADRILSKEASLSFIIQIQNSKTDGTNSIKSFIETNSYRGRLVFKNNTIENINQEFQYYFNYNSIHNSNGIAYQIKVKSKKIKYYYGIGVFEIKDALPLYFSSDNFIQGRQTTGIFSTGYSQNLGFQLKLFRKILFSSNILYNNESIENEDSFKLITSLRYP